MKHFSHHKSVSNLLALSAIALGLASKGLAIEATTGSGGSVDSTSFNASSQPWSYAVIVVSDRPVIRVTDSGYALTENGRWKEGVFSSKPNNSNERDYGLVDINESGTAIGSSCIFNDENNQFGETLNYVWLNTGVITKLTALNFTDYTTNLPNPLVYPSWINGPRAINNHGDVLGDYIFAYFGINRQATLYDDYGPYTEYWIDDVFIDDGFVWSNQTASSVKVGDAHAVGTVVNSSVTHYELTGKSKFPTDFNDSGIQIGRTLDYTSTHDPLSSASTYYVGSQEVSFEPLRINNPGSVVGQKNDKIILRENGTDTVVGVGRPVSLSDAGLILSSGGQVDSSPKIWLKNTSPQTGFKAVELSASIDPDWTVGAMHDISKDGLIAGSAYKSPSLDVNGVILLPAELAVDYNRDGIVTLSKDATSSTDSDRTTQQKPFQFWSNDDDDGIFSSLQETEEDDLEITNTQNEDWRNNVIDVTRDLEDFARLHLNIGGMHDAFKNGQLHLGFKWTDTNGTNPAIKLYRATDADGGTGYLNNVNAANTQSFEVAIVDARHPAYSGPPWASNYTVIGTGDFFVLPSLQSINLSATNPTLRFVFEGCTTGKGQLKLVILKQESGTYTEIGEGPGVWMDIKKPHEFIQRWTCGDGSLTPVQPVQFVASKSGAFSAPTKDEERDLVLYIHGYNMLADWEKQRWIETTYKRLYLLGYKGRVGGFTWPCVLDNGSQFDPSEELAWQSGAELRSLLATLKGQGYRVHVLAHSMGNVVMGEALRLAGVNSELVTTYVASQAAIAAHCYDASLPDRTDFTPSTPNVYGRYWTSGQSQSLPETWGSLSPSYLAPTYTQGSARKFVNFYNPQDWALTGNGLNILPGADDGSQTGWLTNQRLKPNNGYDYVSFGGFRENPLFNISPRWFEFPNDRFTIFPYCAEARSVALGAVSTGGVFAGSEVNLFSAPINYRNQHIYHSAQFRSFYAQRWQYWHMILDTCQLFPRDQP